MIFIVMLILHMLADFYFQTDSIVKKKREKFTWLVIHSIMYGGVFIIPTIIVLILYHNNIIIYATLIILISHFIVDYIKSVIEKKMKPNSWSIIVFSIDQMIHIGILYFTYCIFELDKFNGNYKIDILNKSFSLYNVLIYILMIIILLKPTSIFVKKCLSIFSESDKANKPNIQTSISNAGKAIGYFERLLTMVLILANQYSLLGLVLTAKSIARFKDFSDEGFAEKYLIGTLASFITSLSVVLLLNSFLI